MSERPGTSKASRVLAKAPLLLGALFVAAFVIAPLALMLVDTLVGKDGWTLSAWTQLLATDTDRVQLWRTVQLGLAGTAVALVLGAGQAWVTLGTDLPGAAWLAPLGALPLAIPPILVAMGVHDVVDATGFWWCATILGIAHAPFVAVLTARGLRGVDGRIYESALLARGRTRAELLVARLLVPEMLAGALLAFAFIIGEHGVPEFLSIKGKNWLTYSEGVFYRWNLRTQLGELGASSSAIVASVPLVACVALAIAFALRLRGDATRPGDFRPLPTRRLGALRLPALAVPLLYLGAGVVLPLAAMARWAAGSTSAAPMSLATFERSIGKAFAQAGGDIGYTLLIAAGATALLLAVAMPLAHRAARGRGRGSRWPELISVLAVAVPAVLLGIGLVRLCNREGLVGLYDGPGMVIAAYAARFLPFGVLTLAAAARRIPRETEEAARLTGRAPLARFARVLLPLWGPALVSAACLIFVLALRELDLAVVLPAGNGTVVRRVSNVVHFGGQDLAGALSLILLLIAVVPPIAVVVATGRKPEPLS